MATKLTTSYNRLKLICIIIDRVIEVPLGGFKGIEIKTSNKNANH